MSRAVWVNVAAMRLEDSADRKLGDAGGHRTGIELGDVEQGVEQLVHIGDCGVDAHREAVAFGLVLLGAQLRGEQVQGVQRLAQIVTRCRKETRLRQIGRLQLLGALLHLALERRVGGLQLARHVVQLLSQRFELVSRLDRDAMIELASADARRSGGQGADGNHHQARHQQCREQRQNEPGQQYDNGTHDGIVERRVGFVLGQLHQHQPVERVSRGVRRQHAFAAKIARNLRFLEVGCLCRRACRPDLGKLREVGIAQHEADLGMGDEPALRIDDVGPSILTDPDLIDHVPDEGEVDLGYADAGIPARARHGERHERLGATPEIDRPVVDFVGERRLELFLRRVVGIAADLIHGLSRNVQLLPPLVIEQRQLRDRRHLAQQSAAVERTLLGCRGLPGQVGRPAELALYLPDELADLGRCRDGLLFLDAEERRAMITDREPDIDKPVDDE